MGVKSAYKKAKEKVEEIGKSAVEEVGRAIDDPVETALALTAPGIALPVYLAAKADTNLKEISSLGSYKKGGFAPVSSPTAVLDTSTAADTEIEKKKKELLQKMRNSPGFREQTVLNVQ